MNEKLTHIVLAIMLIVFPACSGPETAETLEAGIASSTTVAEKGFPSLDSYPGLGLNLDFGQDIHPALFYKSDGYSNGGEYDCEWSEKNVTITPEDTLSLAITPNATGKLPWLGAEICTNVEFSYGKYETSMQVPGEPGTVVFFGTYSKNGDEIDIEFNGSKPSEVELNYFSKGVNSKGKVIDLGFDASKGFHDYGFLWEEDKITWYIDNKEAWSTDYHETGKKVDTPAPIIMSIWPGTDTLADWLGHYSPSASKVEAKYDWIHFTPLHLTQE